MTKRKTNISKQFGIFAITFTLVMSQGGMSYDIGSNVDAKPSRIYIGTNVIKKYGLIDVLKGIKQEDEEPESPKLKSEEFIITAYDLSERSTNKLKNHPAYGITKSGYNLKNKSWRTARVVSVDPDVIPLGSKVLIEFEDEKYKKYNGVYSCDDIGSSIQGNHIDFFLGDFHSQKPSKETIKFGKTTARVTILSD